MKILSAFLLSICSATVIAPSYAATFKPIQSDKCNYVLDGAIEADDAAKVQKLIETNQEYSLGLCLNSPGGSYYGGRELYTVFMTEGVRTYVRAGDECHSACAIAFLGGSEWGDYRHPSRKLEPGAVLGFHAPYLTPDNSKAYTADFVSTTMQLTIEIVNELIKDQESLKISKKFLTDFILMNSRDTKAVVTVNDAANAGVTIDTPTQSISLNDTNIGYACRTLFDIFGDEFVNYSSAVKPQFETEKSEFSSNSVGKLEINEKKWRWISTKHDFETPCLTASCAISEEPDHNGDYEVVLWSNDVSADADLPSAIQKITTTMPWWYLLDGKTSLSSLTPN